MIINNIVKIVSNIGKKYKLLFCFLNGVTVLEYNLEIRDPIYGFVKLTDFEKKIISDSAFQRLRRIKQLALTCMVFPSATNTRFPHSIGTMHLASNIYDCITKKKNHDLLKNYVFEDDHFDMDYEKQMIRIAALLHDVGHAPFSHGGESIMPVKEDGKRYNHEDYTVELIKKHFKAIIEANGHNPEEIASLIKPNPKPLGRRIFWHQIISGAVDADRADYLLRDSHHCGVKYGLFDYFRLLETICIGIDKEEDELLLSIHEKGWHAAEALLIARYKFYSQVCYHKTRNAYDYHLEKAMKTVLNGEFSPPSKLEKYLEYDDSFMEYSFDQESKDCWHCKSIVDRDHIRKVHHSKEYPNHIEIADFYKKIEKIKKANFWEYDNKEILSSDKQWYYPQNRKKEIFIHSKNELLKLSDYSPIVNNMNEYHQLRIYAKPKERKEVLDILRN